MNYSTIKPVQKTLIYAFVVLLTMVFSSCSNTRSFSQQKEFSKRKYTAGIFKPKRRKYETVKSETLSTTGIPSKKRVGDIHLEIREVLSSTSSIELKKDETTNIETIKEIIVTNNCSSSASKKASRTSKSSVLDTPSPTNFTVKNSLLERSTRENDHKKIDHIKRKYHSSGPELWEIMIAALMAGILFGVFAIAVVEGTVIFYLFAILAASSFLILAAALLAYPLGLLLDEIF